jgi:hypothetical protein
MIFKKRYDGGPDSGVTGYWLIEIKWLFSIVLLKFNPNNRENFHSHAFNAITLWLKGEVVEETINIETQEQEVKPYRFGQLKYTPRDNVHKIHCRSTAWAISFRGPWSKTWIEYNKDSDKIITLSSGRTVIEE